MNPSFYLNTRKMCLFSFLTAGDKISDDEEVEKKRFCLLKTQVFFMPINKNEVI